MVTCEKCGAETEYGAIISGLTLTMTGGEDGSNDVTYEPMDGPELCSACAAAEVGGMLLMTHQYFVAHQPHPSFTIL